MEPDREEEQHATMISMGAGIEAALNLESPAAAAGGSAGPVRAGNCAGRGRSVQAAEEGPHRFHAELRAAAGGDQPGAAGARPPRDAEPAAVPNDAQQACEAGPQASDDRCVEPEPAEAAAPAMERGGLESVCRHWLDLLRAGSPAESPAAGAPTDAPGGENPIPKECAGAWDRLRRLLPSAAGGANGPSDPAALPNRVAERLEALPAPPGGPAAERPPEILAEALQPPGEDPPGAASGKPAAEDERAVAELLKGMSGRDGRAPAGSGAFADIDGRGTREGLEIQAAIRGARMQAREADGASRNAPPAKGPEEAGGTPGNAPAGVATTPAAANATIASGSALRGTHSPEGARTAAAPPSQPPEGRSDGSGRVLEGGQQASAESGDFRHPPGEAILPRMQAPLPKGSGEGEALHEGVAGLTREAHLPPSAEGGLEKGADAPSALRDKEAAATGRAGVFEQIVQRAAVQLKNDQGEISIDLKPDFLGRVRMQILTENQQVSVRIVAELSAVRDMIETGLHQLKSELQSQGLQVERLEVAVADDQRQQNWQPAHSTPLWKAAAGGEGPADERAALDESLGSFYRRPRSGGTAAVDMFV